MNQRNSAKVIILFLIIVIFSCKSNNNKDNVLEGHTYNIPITKPFEFSEEVPIIWDYTDPDSISPPKTYPLDVDKFPSKPFSINTFKPLEQPMQEFPLDWDNLPTDSIRFDTLEKQEYSIKKSIIPAPVISKVEMPNALEGTPSALMELSQNEGLPSSLVRSIVQDDFGITWFATDRGLSMYDGENLYTYPHIRAWDMALDNSGKLWLVTNNEGIYVLDLKNGVEWHCDITGLFIDILCDHQGKIWLIRWRDGVYFVDEEMDQLTKLLHLLLKMK